MLGSTVLAQIIQTEQRVACSDWLDEGMTEGIVGQKCGDGDVGDGGWKE